MPITALYGSLLALLLILLALVTVKLRRSLRVGLGDGGNRDLQRAIRAHGNASEYIPLFLILLAAYELNHGGELLLHGFGAVFFASRVLHAWGIYSSGGSSPGRFVGTAGTLMALLTLAVANVLKIL